MASTAIFISEPDADMRLQYKTFGVSTNLLGSNSIFNANQFPMYLLIPGRHQLLTQFQFQYIQRLIQKGLQNEQDVYGKPVNNTEKIEAVVFAVTSANHSNTRRNPLPFYLRAISIEAFGNALSTPTYIYGIDDVGQVPILPSIRLNVFSTTAKASSVVHLKIRSSFVLPRY